MSDYVTLPGVPESVTREQYLWLVTGAGFSGTDDLESLEFRPDGIYAVVYAKNEKGNRFVDPETGDAVTHRVYVRVEDPE